MSSRSSTKSLHRAASMRRLVDGLTIVVDEDAKRRLLFRLRHVERPTVVSFVNAHAFNLAWSTPEVRHSLTSSDIVLRDGLGMELLLRWLGRDPGINANGTDLIPELLHSLKGRRIVLYGTREPHLSAARATLADRGIYVTATENGFRSDEHYLAIARSDKPEVIVLGMGMPKQESVALQLAASLAHPCLIVNGGAIIDFLGNRFPRAPLWVRQLKAEWVYRLLQEPIRLFNRYVIGNGLFLVRAGWLAWVHRDVSVSPAE